MRKIRKLLENQISVSQNRRYRSFWKDPSQLRQAVVNFFRRVITSNGTGQIDTTTENGSENEVNELFLLFLDMS